jgi:thiol:disulfide interchange protein DsbD
MKLVLLFFLLLITTSVFSQEKVIWSNVYNQKSKTIEMTATIVEGWHLYSQIKSEEIGPVPTSFAFTSNELVTLTGSVSEPKPYQEFDPNFETTLNFFKDKVTFSQKAVASQTTTQEIIISFMVCNSIMCMPPIDQKFTVEIKPN